MCTLPTCEHHVSVKDTTCIVCWSRLGQKSDWIIIHILEMEFVGTEILVPIISVHSMNDMRYLTAEA